MHTSLTRLTGCGNVLQEAMCERTIQHAYQACKSDVKTRKRQMLGRGTAFLYEPSPYISYCVKDGVHVLFAGEVAEWPGVHAVDEAHDGKPTFQCAVMVIG